jgi:uncharacterized protein YjeT (DUF2065 family)
MKRTRWSLFYLAGYALPSGLMLMAAPQLVTKMLFSNGTYPDVIIRMVGVPLACLGIFIVQLIRHRAENLYSTTLLVRVFIISSFVGLYVSSSDPMFLSLIGIVGLGFVLTLTGFLLDRREAQAAPAR